MIPINVYYHNTLLERLLEKSRQDFPIAGIAIKLEQEHSAEMQAGAHEMSGLFSIRIDWLHCWG